MTRPSWDTHFLTLARIIAERSTCNRAKVGAIITRDNHQLATGYNGTPSGLDHCSNVGCLVINNHCARTVHAECNAVIQAALHGVSTAGSTLYATHYPCLACCKMLINAGVVRVVYSEAYNVDPLAVEFFDQAGVEVVQIRKKKNENRS